MSQWDTEEIAYLKDELGKALAKIKSLEWLNLNQRDTIRHYQNKTVYLKKKILKGDPRTYYHQGYDDGLDKKHRRYDFYGDDLDDYDRR